MVGGEPVPRWAVRAAYAVPLCVLPSGLWRIALVLGAPGYGDGAGTVGLKIYILVLTLISEVLALLTLGLVQPWGERVPRWVPLLGGRRIPVAMAVVPAALGAAALIGLVAYIVLNRYVFDLHFTPTVGPAEGSGFPDHGPAYWIAVICYAPLLAWGPLLAAVTVAYHRRRTRHGPASRSPDC